MITSWESIADCLRKELASYGGLLNLFEEQQRCLFARNPDAVLQLSTAIEAHALDLTVHRRERERLVADFAIEEGLPAGTTLRALLPRIDSDARPLLEALIAEVNRLLHRVRRASRHNHTLLASAVEVHQQALQHLRPEAFTRTYASSGRMAGASAGVPATLRATG